MPDLDFISPECFIKNWKSRISEEDLEEIEEKLREER